MVLAAALATSLGIAGGWGLSGAVRKDPSPAAEHGTPTAVEGEPAAGDVGVGPPQAFDPADRDLDYGEMLEALEALEAAGMRVIPTRALFRLDAPAVAADGTVSDVVAQALLLSDDEVERLNRLIGEAGERLREIELERLETVHVSDDRAVFRIPGFAAEGATVEESLREGILTALGETDGTLFWELMVDGLPYQWEDFWRGFGREEIVVVFERRVVEDDGLQLRVEAGPPRDGAPADGTGEQTHGGSSMIRVGPNGPHGTGAFLAGRHRYLHELLPEDLEGYFAQPLSP